MPIISNCNQCKCLIKIKPSLVSVNGNFCNRTCWKLYKKENLTIKINCLNCGSEFSRPKSRLKYGRGKHCSAKCQYESRRNAPKTAIQINMQPIYPRLANGSIVQINNGTYKYSLYSSGKCEFQLKGDYGRKDQLCNMGGTIYFTEQEVADMITNKEIILIDDCQAKFWDPIKPVSAQNKTIAANPLLIPQAKK